jgi:hypothetical protein
MRITAYFAQLGAKSNKAADIVWIEKLEAVNLPTEIDREPDKNGRRPTSQASDKKGSIRFGYCLFCAELGALAIWLQGHHGSSIAAGLFTARTKSLELVANANLQRAAVLTRFRSKATWCTGRARCILRAVLVADE